MGTAETAAEEEGVAMSYAPEPYQVPPQPPKRSRKGLWIVLAIVGVVGVAVLAGGTFFLRKMSSYVPTAGDCVAFHSPHETDLNKTARPLRADCNSAEATFEIVTDSDTEPKCPDEYTIYQWMTKKEGKPATVSKTWCMAPNLLENHCYLLDAKDLAQVADTSCTKPGSLRVLKRIDGPANDAVCAALNPDAKVLSFTRPTRTFCLALASP